MYAIALAVEALTRECMQNSSWRNRRKKALIFADTPLQIFNAIVLAESPEFSEVDSDLVVYKQFDLQELNMAAIEDLNCFSSVATIDAMPFKGRWDRRLRSYKSLLIKEKDSLIGGEKAYDIFALTCPTVITNRILRELRLRNVNLVVIMYEDGTGTYNGNVLRSLNYLDDLPEGVEPNGLKLDLQIKLVRAIAPRYIYHKPQDFYLYRPDLATANYPSLHTLAISTETFDALSRVFRTSPNPPLGGSEVLVFDIARTNQEGIEDSEMFDSALKDIAALRNPVWLKRHPRTTVESEVIRNLNEFPNEMWEMSCRKRGIQDWFLIGLASSAMLTPCLIHGIEPRLVFLFEYEGLAQYHANESCREIYRIALTLYSDPTRIVCPKTREELTMALEKGTIEC